MTEIVAEISGNHGGSLDNALRLILDANEAGADAVKFQCFDPERLAVRRANNPEVLALAGGVPLIELYRRTWTPRAWFPAMIAHAKTYNMPWFSSVFDPSDVDFLETLGCPRYKISAFEMLDWDIIKAVRETGKPIVMSVRPTPGVTILQATDYSGAMVPLGLSAHGAIPPPVGAPMVEYHLRLEGVETPDTAFSLDCYELRQYTKTLYVVADVRTGGMFTEANVQSISARTKGLSPAVINQVIGKLASYDIRCGEPMHWGMIDGEAEQGSVYTVP